jgi:hypothetical protein
MEKVPSLTGWVVVKRNTMSLLKNWMNYGNSMLCYTIFIILLQIELMFFFSQKFRYLLCDKGPSLVEKIVNRTFPWILDVDFKLDDMIKGGFKLRGEEAKRWFFEQEFSIKKISEEVISQYTDGNYFL